MSPDLDVAHKRLQAALGQLEAALARRLGGAGRPADLETELQLMQDDRARLAIELDSASARVAQVENAAEHVGLRLRSVTDLVRAVVDRAEPPARIEAGR